MLAFWKWGESCLAANTWLGSEGVVWTGEGLGLGAAPG